MKILTNNFLSDIGPREKNDDSCICFEIELGIKVLAVADGVGGYARGDIASKIAIDTLIEEFQSKLIGKDIKEAFLKIISQINSKIINYSLQKKLKNVSTTFVFAVIYNNECYFCNVGDSRGYIISNNEIRFQTKDHSLVQELLDNDIITKEEAIDHPHKNIITKGLGLKNTVEPDFYEESLHKGDIIILSSDGLHDYISEQKLIDIVSENSFEKEICLNLIKEALKSTSDNVSVVVFKY